MALKPLLARSKRSGTLHIFTNRICRGLGKAGRNQKYMHIIVESGTFLGPHENMSIHLIMYKR